MNILWKTFPPEGIFIGSIHLFDKQIKKNSSTCLWITCFARPKGMKNDVSLTSVFGILRVSFISSLVCIESQIMLFYPDLFMWSPYMELQLGSWPLTTESLWCKCLEACLSSSTVKRVFLLIGKLFALPVLPRFNQYGQTHWLAKTVSCCRFKEVLCPVYWSSHWSTTVQCYSELKFCWDSTFLPCGNEYSVNVGDDTISTSFKTEHGHCSSVTWLGLSTPVWLGFGF